MTLSDFLGNGLIKEVKMKYYILCGAVDLNDKISDFRLIAPSQVTRRYPCSNERNTHGIRIDCDKSQIEKWSCDCYATSTEDTLIKDANPEVFTLIDGKWAKNEELTRAYLSGQYGVDDFTDWLARRKYHFTNYEIGYTNKPFNRDEWYEGEKEKARNWINEHRPELTDLEKRITSTHLAHKMVCVNDKGFDKLVDDVIQEAKEDIECWKEATKSADPGKTEFKNILLNQ